MLYYGLSQATQAVLAARRNPKGEQQAATSHGTDCLNRDQIVEVGDLEVCTTRSQTGAFAMLAAALGCPVLPGRTALRQLWVSLPEGVLHPPTRAGDLFGAALLERRDHRRFGDTFPDETGTSRVAKLIHLPYHLMPLDVAEVEQLILERYPTLRNFRVIESPQCPEVAHWVLNLDPPGLRASLSFDRQGQPMQHSEAYGMGRLGPRGYARPQVSSPEVPSIWVPPTLPGNTEPLHPLVTWYAVLFGLSELARYRPTAWASAININTSADAAALEHLMDAAHLACVNLIAELFEIRSPDGIERNDARRLHTERVFAWQRRQVESSA